jgi:phosphoribosylformylglycinamidine synthase
MFAVRNGFGNSMIIPLWETLFKNLVVTQGLFVFMELIKQVAASVDSSAVYCWAHPLTGGKQVVCESFRNLISVGAKPVAITNCLNFGSPENEENMGEFVECVQGIGEAAEYLKFPVVSGNVSFYNQTKEEGIKPTPSIGGVGLIKDYKKMVTMDFKQVE